MEEQTKLNEQVEQLLDYWGCHNNYAVLEY